MIMGRNVLWARTECPAEKFRKAGLHQCSREGRAVSRIGVSITAQQEGNLLGGDIAYEDGNTRRHQAMMSKRRTR